MAPLLVLGMSLLPSLTKILAGDTAGQVAATVTAAVRQATGTDDPVAAQAALAADPAATIALQQRLAAGSFDEAAAVDIELQPGRMSLHDVYMIHGAKANRSTQRRTGVALRYMPATSLFDRSLNPVAGKSGVAVSFATRPLWLLRGVDRSGRNDFEIGHHR